MNYEELTEAQRKALKLRPKKTAIYESETTVIDETTGEILRRESKTVAKTNEEPDFIKVYYKTMLAFADAEGVPLDFVLAIASFISWSNNGSEMRYKNDRPNREEVCASLNIKEAMYKRYLKRCVNCGLLFPSRYRGCYDVNPFFIAKGQWDSIRQLQMSLDFVSGKWKRRTAEPEHVDLHEPLPEPAAADPAQVPGQMAITDYPEAMPGGKAAANG